MEGERVHGVVQAVPYYDQYCLRKLFPRGFRCHPFFYSSLPVLMETLSLLEGFFHATDIKVQNTLVNCMRNSNSVSSTPHHTT